MSTPKPARIHSSYGFTSSQVELGEAEGVWLHGKKTGSTKSSSGSTTPYNGETSWEK